MRLEGRSTLASARQGSSNRRNAQRSKGPRTSEGRARSSKNALSHGALAQQVLLPSENESDLADLRDDLRQELRPQGPLQEQWFEVIVDGFWRLQRIRRAEVGVLWVEIMMQRQLKMLCDRDIAQPQLPDGLDPDALELGRAYASEAEPLGKLNRYETSIIRRIERAITTLERLQAAEKAQSAEPQDIIDITPEPEVGELAGDTVGSEGNGGLRSDRARH